MSKKVVILGDSIAKGIVFSEEKNRYTRLDGDCVSRIAQMSSDLEIRNLASMGRTSTDALASLDQTQISAGDYVVVEYGGNDSDMLWKYILCNCQTASHMIGSCNQQHSANSVQPKGSL